LEDESRAAAQLTRDMAQQINALTLALEGVARTARRGLALGIARWKIITVIVLKTASKGIVTGVLVALARVAGETAPLLFTALGNSFWSHSLKEPIAALPLQIFSYAISPYDDWHRQAWAGALVLMLLILALNLTVRVLSRDRSK